MELPKLKAVSHELTTELNSAQKKKLLRGKALTSFYPEEITFKTLFFPYESEISSLLGWETTHFFTAQNYHSLFALVT